MTKEQFLIVVEEIIGAQQLCSYLDFARAFHG